MPLDKNPMKEALEKVFDVDQAIPRDLLKESREIILAAEFSPDIPKEAVFINILSDGPEGENLNFLENDFVLNTAREKAETAILIVTIIKRYISEVTIDQPQAGTNPQVGNNPAEVNLPVVCTPAFDLIGLEDEISNPDSDPGDADRWTRGLITEMLFALKECLDETDDEDEGWPEFVSAYDDILSAHQSWVSESGGASHIPGAVALGNSANLVPVFKNGKNNNQTAAQIATNFANEIHRSTTEAKWTGQIMHPALPIPFVPATGFLAVVENSAFK